MMSESVGTTLICLLGLLCVTLSSSAPPQCTGNYCGIKSISKSAFQGFHIPSPDGSQFIINQLDDTGKSQVYVGKTGSDVLNCITCKQQPGGPAPHRYHYQPTWHPSGKWIFMSVENDEYTVDFLIYKVTVINGTCSAFDPFNFCKSIVGFIQSGIYVNMWVCSVDGVKCYKLTNFDQRGDGWPNGYTGPATSPDGNILVWSEAVGSPLTCYPFGCWHLIQAEFHEILGIPGLFNQKNITPAGTTNPMNWNEPGNISPEDGVSILLSGSYNDRDQQGMDQYILNLKTGKVVDITNTPTIWDEHGVFSPNGLRVVFTSAYPYRNESGSSTVFGYKTEIMMMNKDGSNSTQLSHFRTPGYLESGDASAALGWFDLDGQLLHMVTLGPGFVYGFWDLQFNGPCGLCP